MSNMYKFVETFNPLGGECSHKCSYCYRKGMMRFPINKEKYSGKPRLIYGKSGMDKNLGNGNFWFVGSMTDIFAEDVPRECILRILEYCNKFPSNKYLFQSKNPRRFKQFLSRFPENTTLCVTIETIWQHLLTEYSATTDLYGRVQPLLDLNKDFKNIMITIEPIMDFRSVYYFIETLKAINPIQVNIGADSGNNNLPEPPKEKILELISELEKFTTVHQKPNLGRLLK